MEELRDRLKRMVFWKPDVRLVAFISVIMLGLLLIPLLRIAFYSIPWYDDYMYGVWVKNFLEQDYSLKSVLDGANYCMRMEWYAWQGTFSSIFLMALVPMVWGEKYYFLGPLFLILILTVAVMVCVTVLLRRVLNADRASAVTVAAGVTAMALVLIYQPTHAFYWYNGGVHYIAMHSFLLLLITAWVSLLSCRGRMKTILLILWTLLGAVLAGGSNYVTSLQGMLIGLGMLGIGCLLRRKQTLRLLPSVIVYAAAFYISVSAPGNQVRGAVYEDCGMSTDAVTAILNSFVEAVRFMKVFSWQMTLAVMLLLAPIIWRCVRKSSCRFRWPGLVLLLSFCLYATGFTSSLYVTGAVVLARVVNVAKITYQILVILNEVYWMGWVCRRMERRAAADEGARKDPVDTSKSVPLVFFAAVGVLMLGIFAADPQKEAHFSSWTAYHYVHTGEANEFHKQYLRRIEEIKNGGEIVTVAPYVYRPWILATSDLSEDPGSEQNTAMANWYKKQAIICSGQ